MRAGEFPDGAHVLRAKIDMQSPNLNMRDPVLYRIRRAHHHRTGDAWCIYPMYDYAHPISDAIEGITHSLCTLEFEDHRPLYDWLVRSVPVPATPRQIEFARLNLTYTVMSKRKLLQLVRGAPRQRLGRPAHADALGHEAARLHAGRDSPVLRRRGCGKAREPGRPRPARVLRARRPQQAGAACHGGPQPAQDRARELPGRSFRGHGRRQQPGRFVGRHAEGAVLQSALRRARRFHGRPLEEVLPAGARPRGASAQRVPHHLHGRRQRRCRHRRRAALHLRPGEPWRQRA